MNKKIIIGIVIVVFFAVGFLAGMEYKAYQIRSAIADVFSPEVAPAQSEDEGVYIDKQIGEEVQLATLTFKVSTSSEMKIISASSYGDPLVAQSGAKFVKVNMSVTNTTNSKFNLSDHDFQLTDDKGRRFTGYEKEYTLDDALELEDLNPGITKNGTFVYEIPEDVSSYSIIIGKAGTNQIYRVRLK